MNNHQSRSRRLSGLILFLAGLLYLLGMAADPLVHAFASPEHTAESAVVGAPDESSDDAELPVPHGDPQCLLCKSAGALVLTVPQAVPADASHGRGLFQTSRFSRALPSFSLPQPRAPPQV